ncbi:hypothetical protein AB0D49_28900 [Streptomyces sp. NPDC048290]|uniref:hypothetical protein n=1 Tax=Streptomyces sp. NPDC048290 TaxID=3155811 RepID=UPI003431A32F
MSGSEFTAALMPGARVVKAFNTLYGPYIAADHRHAAGRQIHFLADDDTDANANATVSDLADDFGFAPIDLGSLHEGGRPMQLGGPHALQQSQP